jgi:glycerophosphoryl diester phosphodiesterase
VDADGTLQRVFHLDRNQALMAAAALVAIVAALVLVIPRLHGDSGAARSGPSSGAAGSGAGSKVATTTPAEIESSPPPAPGAFAEGGGEPAALVVLAHRGGSEKYPHESLPALVSAAKAGDAVETDVRWTSDNVPILVHEDTIGPAAKASIDVPLACTGGPYVVAKTSWPVLSSRCRTIARASKDGRRYPIATLDETMKAIAAVPGARIFAEVKAENETVPQTAMFLTIIEKYGMAKRAVVTSFFPDALQRVWAQTQADGVHIDLMLFLDTGKKLPPAAELSAEHLYAVAVPAATITAAYVRTLKAKGLIVIDWTVNTKAQWAAAKAVGANAVLTDLPGAYRATLG